MEVIDSARLRLPHCDPVVDQALQLQEEVLAAPHRLVRQRVPILELDLKRDFSDQLLEIAARLSRQKDGAVPARATA